MNKRIIAALLIAASLTVSSCSTLRSVREHDETAGSNPGQAAETAAVTSAETEALVPAVSSEPSVPAVTSASETSDETSETSETAMPADEEGVPLSDAEASAFFSSTADTYLMSSGAGGWGAYVNVSSDGSFDYNYHDADYGMYYICHAQGQLGNVVMINDYTYKVQILQMTYEHEVDSQWTDIDTDGTEINYTGADSYGLHEGDILIYYVRGIETSELPEGYLYWYCAPRALQPEDVPVQFALSGYYNAVEEAAYIEDDYE